MTEARSDLPEAFVQKMKGLLGPEYESFLAGYEAERAWGLRINPLKTGTFQAPEEIAERFGLTKVPWAQEGYYFSLDTRPGKHPFHEAGVYYIQEPSAMAATELLDPKPGEAILDLCAAPGGKTTHIGGRMLGQGFLLANEIHPARAKILSQNVERLGIANSVVSNEEPAVLANRFPCFFDRILVDAPCSGEGMFRKDPEAMKQWSPDNVLMCAKRQGEILNLAADMLKPGGRLVYSTCTFSPEEDEQTVQQFLERHPSFSIEPAPVCPQISHGRPQWAKGHLPVLKQTFRIWPHKARGEGHYMAVLRKDPMAQNSGNRKIKMPAYVKDPAVIRAWRTFAEETFTIQGRERFFPDTDRHLVLFGDQLYRIPDQAPDLKGLHILRPGLHLGTLKKNRFEPSHALALSLAGTSVKRLESYEPEDPKLLAYLKGEALKTRSQDSGWVLMMTRSYSVGWAKQTGDTLKNHYPKGLRRF